MTTVVRKWDTRQVFAQYEAGVRWTPCETQKTAVSKKEHNILVMHWLFKPFECDGRRNGAGDGTRTRDSLLGKQELYH